MSIIEKLFRMDGRVVVVNGGAGRIGSQMCLAIADAGAKVVVLDLDQQRATDVAEKIASSGGQASVSVLTRPTSHPLIQRWPKPPTLLGNLGDWSIQLNIGAVDSMVPTPPTIQSTLGSRCSR